MKRLLVLFLLAGTGLFASVAAAAVPEQVSYQGRLTDGQGNPTPGPVDMEFLLYDQPTFGTLLWSEAQSNVPLTNGVFDVFLGSVNPLNLVFDGPVYLATKVNGNFIGPRVLLGASPYSLNTRSVSDGAAVRSLNGLTDDLRIVGGVNVTVSEAGDSITIAAPGGGGGGADSDWQIVGSDMHSVPSGSVGIGTSNPSGKFHVFTQNQAGTAAFIEDASAGSFALSLLGLKAGVFEGRLQVLHTSSSDKFQMTTLDPGMQIELDSDAEIVFRTANEVRGEIKTDGRITFERPDDLETVEIDPDGGIDGGAEIEVRNAGGIRQIVLETTLGGAGMVNVKSGQSTDAVRLEGQNGGSSNGGGIVSVNQESGLARIQLEGSEAGNSTDGAQITLFNDFNQATTVIEGDLGGTDAGAIQIFNSNGVETVDLRAQESTDAANGASLKLRDDAGVTRIELDADFGTSGEGRVITDVLEITGGSDLSEQFEVGGSAEPGTVLRIDAENPGALAVSTSAYDPQVAGVVSGAGGVKPGMLMGQKGSIADGEVPVALTGRVYCWVDASYGAVRPGDLLTTSPTPGHAMKAADRDRSQGAILGKAMTALPEGRGLVLVLVALQ